MLQDDELTAMTLSGREVRWLLGHTAYEDGIGSDIYRRLQRLNGAPVPQQMSERLSSK
jgi:hypothetical protein